MKQHQIIQTPKELDFKNKIAWGFYFNLVWTLIVYFSLSFLILFSFFNANEIVKENNTSLNYILSLLGISLLLLAYTFMMVMNIWSVKYGKEHFKEKLFYSFLALNFIRFGWILYEGIKTGLIRFRFQRWTIFDITLIGFTIAVLLVLKAVDMVIPSIPPLYLSLSLHYLALFFICFVTGSFLKTLFVGFIGGFLLFIFPITFLNFAQYMFDYLIPMCVFSLSFFVAFQASERKTKLQAMQWIVFVIVPFIFVLFSRIVGGVMFWSSDSWTGVSVWFFSTVINSINTGFDLIISLILVPTILSRLWFLKEKYEQRNNR